MMWAILGDIEFEVLASPTGWEERFGGQFAEHERISAKPLLESVGGQLGEINWDIRVHHSVHDVQMRLREIRQAAQAQEPMALVLGDGDYLGPWVIGDCAVTARKTSSGGQLISADANVTLREYAGEFERPAARLGLLDSAAKPGLLTQLSLGASTAQKIASAARTVQTAVRTAGELVRDAQAIIHNPALIISRVPAVLGNVGDAIVGAQVLRTAGEALQDAGELVTLGMGVWSDMQAVQSALTPMHAQTVADQLSQAAYGLERSGQRIHGARQSITRLTAAIATRQV